MQNAMKKIRYLSLWLILIVISISACTNNPTPEITEAPSESVTEITATDVDPSQTPFPAAAIVNGERISLAFYESEVDRYFIAQEANGNPVDDETEARAYVLDDLIDLTLLAQGARELGVAIEDSEVQAKIDDLSAEVDLATWMGEWGYTQETLFESLKLQMLAAVMRQEIISAVPEVLEQVNIQQVFAYTSEGAENALVSLRSGRDFDDVAYTYDPLTGGNLGWVPRGYLLVQAVEDTAFSLPVGGYSEIIESDVGYHIVMVLDREERPVTGDARLVLQRKALYTWLDEQRSVSSIEVLVN